MTNTFEKVEDSVLLIEAAIAEGDNTSIQKILETLKEEVKDLISEDFEKIENSLLLLEVAIELGEDKSRDKILNILKEEINQ